MGGTVLVAGATGSVGRALVRILSRAGVVVRAAARRRASLNDLEAAQTVEFDYTNPPTMARMFRGVDRVFMAAPLGTDMAGVTDAMVAAAQRAGVRRFVRLSCQGAVFPEALILGRWHRAAEQVVEQSGMSWTHLRPNSLMQNFTTHHLRSMKVLGLYHDPVGSSPVSHVDADDVAAVAAAVLIEPGHEGQSYSLTGPSAVSSHEVAALFSRVAGREIRCVEVSIESTRDAMFGFGLPVPVVDAIAELYRWTRDGRFAEVTTVVERLLHRPARDFTSFAKEQRVLFLQGDEQK